MFWDRLSTKPTWIVFIFQMSVGSDSEMNENDKDPYQQSCRKIDEISICEEILKDVGNILNEFPDVPEFNFPADTSHFDFDPNPIYQSTFPADTPVQLDSIHSNLDNQGATDVSNNNSIGTPSNNLLLRESANVLENGPKKKRARTQAEKSDRNAKKYPVLSPCKESCSKRCITMFCHRVKNHAAKGVLPSFPVMIEPY